MILHTARRFEMSCFRLTRLCLALVIMMMTCSSANATVTVFLNLPSSGAIWHNGFTYYYNGESDWGSSDPVINFVGSYIMKNDSDPNVGLICASESAYIYYRYTAPNGSGSITFQESNTLPATLAPGDTTGGTYYLSVRPYNASYGPIRLNPPAYYPQLYAFKTITFLP